MWYFGKIIGSALPLICAGTLVISIFSAGVSSAGPLSEDDPFFAVPSDIGDYSNGSILDSRPVQPFAVASALPVNAWQLKYKTTDNHGRPSAYVTTALVPKTPWTGPGSRPVLSYQPAEDGVGSKCAPSYALQAGLTSFPPSNSLLETGQIVAALYRGWALIVPDYQGPRSEFLGTTGYAHGILDSLRAARRFPMLDTDSLTPVGMWGYSGGALATAVAAQIQPTYAPDLHITAVALGGLAADVDVLFQNFDSFIGGATGAAGALIIAGIHRSYPEKNVLQYVGAYGHRVVAGLQTDCALDAVAKYPFMTAAKLEAWPGALTANPEFTRILREVSLEAVPGEPSTPVLFYTAANDEFAPIDQVRPVAERYCAAGVPVNEVVDTVGEHGTEMFAGTPVAIGYLADRYAGKPPVDNCHR